MLATRAKTLLCLQCGCRGSDQMTLCCSGVTKEKWCRHFSGKFEDHILQTDSGSYSVLCPKHSNLVGKLPKDGACKVVQESLAVPAQGERAKRLRLEPSLSSSLWSSREDGDLVLECDGVSLRAHGHILAAASPVFKAMLGRDASEGRSSKLVFRDAQVRDVEAALQFAYTGELEDDANAYGVVRIADKYEMDDLVKLCCMRILAELSVETVLAATRALRATEHTTMAAAFEVLADAISRDRALCRAALCEL